MRGAWEGETKRGNNRVANMFNNKPAFDHRDHKEGESDRMGHSCQAFFFSFLSADSSLFA